MDPGQCFSGQLTSNTQMLNDFETKHQPITSTTDTLSNYTDIYKANKFGTLETYKMDFIMVFIERENLIIFSYFASVK